MQNYKITISYDGTKYDGWQIQKTSNNTIQGKISAVLSKMCGKFIEIDGSGRTDAGVHAKGQVASFKTDQVFTTSEILTYLNKFLPEDIAVERVEAVDDKFHARLSCKKKCYRYRIRTSEIPDVFNRKYVYHYTDKTLNINNMQKTAELLKGTHDFKAFCGNPHLKKSSVRTIFDINIKKTTDEIIIDFIGNGFLQKMVRILVGTLISVGNGTISPSEITKIIDSKNRENAGFTAPPQGLMLMWAEY